MHLEAIAATGGEWAPSPLYPLSDRSAGLSSHRHPGYPHLNNDQIAPGGKAFK